MAGKKKKKKPRKRGGARTSPATRQPEATGSSPPSFDRRSMDKTMANIGRLLSEQEFESIDEANAFDEFPVTLTCKVLQVSSSGYNAWYQRPPSAREKTNQEFVKKIKAVYNENLGVYGSPRIHQELKSQGVACSENRVARLMRLRGVRAKQSKRFKTTTKRNKAHPAAPTLLKRNFEAERPDQKWLEDITYIATREGWLYLAAILDLYTHLIVG